MRPHPLKRSRRTVIALALLLGVGALLAACGSSSKSSSSDTTAAGAAASAEAPKKITIAYQLIPNGDLIVKNQGWLEEAFPDTQIEWKLFDSGGAVNQAVTAGSVDIGLAGSSPVSRGLSNELPYQVPWIFDVIGEAEALVVKSDISSIQDLAGKKIATPFASTAHYSLLAALDDAGVDSTTVDIIDAEPADIYAAWTRDDIDGAYVWNPNLASIVADGGKVLVTSADLAAKGYTTYDLAVVTNSFAEKYPAAVTTWVEQQTRAVELLNSDPKAAAEAIAEELNITVEEATAQIEDLIFLTASEQVGEEYLGGGLARNLFAAAEFNKDLGEIDSVQPESHYRDAVVATFAKEASGT
jgi:taurine transport system substrate-binding protein